MEIESREGFIQLAALTSELVDGLILKNLLVHFTDIINGLFAFFEHVVLGNYFLIISEAQELMTFISTSPMRINL